MDLTNLAGNNTINLTKGEAINLTKADPSLEHVHIGLQWDIAEQAGTTYDLDLSTFVLSNGRVLDNNHFLYFNSKVDVPGFTKSGDNRTGAGDGDDEWLQVDFPRVESSVDEIVLVVTIYNAHALRQTFGQVKSAMIHIDNKDTGRTIAQYSLTDDYSTDTGIVFGKLKRTGNSWTFVAIGEGSGKELGNYCGDYGIQV